MVGGTTSAVQSMILYACKRGDKIILPRNVHRSAINALVLSGAVPVYVNPDVDGGLGISLGMALGEVRRAMDANPDAKAVLVNNPTYYGVCSDLTSIARLAHERGMLVLADEAHGRTFTSGRACRGGPSRGGGHGLHRHAQVRRLPHSKLAPACRARRQGGLSQAGHKPHQTTSASYLLMAGLDISRRSLALNGRETLGKVLELAEYAREE
jgi:arginine/lysine/ornithine decarboxylase